MLETVLGDFRNYNCAWRQSRGIPHPWTSSARLPERRPPSSAMHRIDEASRFLPLNRLAISPHYGFASSLLGNVLSEDDQWRKRKRMREVAMEVWRRCSGTRTGSS